MIPDIETQVCEDIKARQNRGIAKYGHALKDSPLTITQIMSHAYEEALDFAIYIKTILIRGVEASSVSASEQAWQPMATAPRDGSRILVACKDRCDNAFIVRYAHGHPFAPPGWVLDSGEFFDATLHYWQPLPKTPSAAIKKPDSPRSDEGKEKFLAWCHNGKLFFNDGTGYWMLNGDATDGCYSSGHLHWIADELDQLNSTGGQRL